MKNKRIIFAWISLIGWITLIFCMSNQPGDVSSKQSDLVIRIFEILGINLTESFGEFATLIVRKVAHFSEYFILYFLVLNLLRYYFKYDKSMIYALILVFVYACSDEIHQHFIPGRVMAFKDVLIDTLGGLLAYLISKILFMKKCK